MQILHTGLVFQWPSDVPLVCMKLSTGLLTSPVISGYLGLDVKWQNYSGQQFLFVVVEVVICGEQSS